MCLVQRVLPNRGIFVWTLDQNARCSVNGTVRQTVNQCRFRPDSEFKSPFPSKAGAEMPKGEFELIAIA